MPSLIYIARIRSISEELAQSLRSSGCHVKSFKPGEITGDECLLAMTSEAADFPSHPECDSAETGQKFAGMPPAPDMNEQLGSQAAIWNSIKTAVSTELRANPEQLASAASTVEPEEIKLAFTPTEVGRRVVSSTQGKASREIARIKPSQIIAVSSSEASDYPKKGRRAIKQCYRVFRNPLSTVVALMVFAVIYRGLVLPSTTASPARTAERSTSMLVLSSAEPPRQPVERVQRHLSHDDLVAEDFTNHFALHAQSDATQHNPDLKHPQSGSKRKRIVVD
jgi:hypothetical protein